MKRKTRSAAEGRPAIALMVEDKQWQKDRAALLLIRRVARLALSERPLRKRGRKGSASDALFLTRARGRWSEGPEEAQAVTILLTNDAKLKALNAQFRGRNKATNVLSFAHHSPFYLGDIAIAYETTAKEARAQKKSFSEHAAHLVMHGILHLFGHDHEDVPSAVAMETLEAELLAKLGIADPYRPRPLTRAKKAA
jgi:probable rRNA maturation factor